MSCATKAQACLNARSATWEALQLSIYSWDSSTICVVQIPDANLGSSHHLQLNCVAHFSAAFMEPRNSTNPSKKQSEQFEKKEYSRFGKSNAAATGPIYYASFFQKFSKPQWTSLYDMGPDGG